MLAIQICSIKNGLFLFFAIKMLYICKMIIKKPLWGQGIKAIFVYASMCIPTRRDANIRDVNGNIRANVAFTLEANFTYARPVV